MNNKIREFLGAQASEYKEIFVSVDKIARNVAVHLPENQSVFVIQKSDLTHIFSCDLKQNQTGVIMKGKCPHYPQYSDDIIRILSLMIYSEVKECNIVGDTKTPLLRFVPIISK